MYNFAWFIELNLNQIKVLWNRALKMYTLTVSVAVWLDHLFDILLTQSTATHVYTH